MLRVGLVCDLREEGWPSMDLVADMLATYLPDVDADIASELLRPPMRRRATRLVRRDASPRAFAVDRYCNRYLDYAWWLRRRRRAFDVFHVLDHSYAHLVHVLPACRTLVTCHDVDAFRFGESTRSAGWYRLIAPAVRSGMRRAALVTCDTRATREEVERLALIPVERLVVVTNGVHPAMRRPTDPAAAREVDRLLGPSTGPELLHVGSTIPRKRIDVLLRAFAVAARGMSGARLLQVGGRLTSAQRSLAASLSVLDWIVEVPPLSVEALACVYRRAALTLLPSDAEGFGLPLVESLACGTPVLASRIPALVEVGGAAVEYAAVADVESWAAAIVRLVAEREREPDGWAERRDEGRRRAAAYDWREYARAMAQLYWRLAEGDGRVARPVPVVERNAATWIASS